MSIRDHISFEPPEPAALTQKQMDEILKLLSLSKPTASKPLSMGCIAPGLPPGFDPMGNPPDKPIVIRELSNTQRGFLYLIGPNGISEEALMQQAKVPLRVVADTVGELIDLGLITNEGGRVDPTQKLKDLIFKQLKPPEQVNLPRFNLRPD